MAIDLIRRFERPPFGATGPEAESPTTFEAVQVLKLFISSPGYARSEAGQTDRILDEVNKAFAARARIAAIGPDGVSLTGAGSDFAPVACDAVVALMRPRLPGDSPDSGDVPEPRSGIAGILAALSGRAPEAGLPDIHIFRFTDPSLSTSDRAAEDADWESRKRVFGDWFKSKGGAFLSFSDFSAPDQYGTMLDAELRGWLGRRGFAAAAEPEVPGATGPRDVDVSERAATTGMLPVEGDGGDPFEESSSNTDAVDIGSFGGDLTVSDRGGTGAETQATASATEAVEFDPLEAVEESAIDLSGFVPVAPADKSETPLALDSMVPDIVEDAGPIGTETAIEAAIADVKAAPVGATHPADGDIGGFDPISPVVPFDAGQTEPAEAIDTIDDEGNRTAETISGMADQGATVPFELEPRVEGGKADLAIEAETEPREQAGSGEHSATGWVNEPATDGVAQNTTATDPLTVHSDSLIEQTATDLGQPLDADVPNSAPELSTDMVDERGGPETAQDGQYRPVIVGNIGSRRAERRRARRSGRAVAPVETAGPVEINQTDTAQPPILAETAAPGAEPLESETAAAEEGKDQTSVEEGSAHDIATAHGSPLADRPDPVADTATDEKSQEAPGTEYASPAIPSSMPDEPDSAMAIAEAANAAALAAAFDEARREREALDEKYRALEAEAKEAVATALRLERDSKAREEAAQRRRHRITWSIFIGLLLLVAIIAIVIGLQWRSAAVGRSQAEKGLALAADQANALLSNLKRLSHQQSSAPDNKAIADQAGKLLGTLVNSGAFDPAEQQRQAEASLATADERFRQGKLPEAAAAAGEAQRLFQTLLAGEPGRSEWLDRLAQSETKAGEILIAQGKPDDALISDQEALAIRQALAARDTANFDWQRSLAAAQQRVGDIMLTKGRLEDGLKIYQDALAIRKMVASKEPDNADAQKDLLEVSNTNGDLRTALNQFDEALSRYRESFAIADTMAKKFPTDDKWARALALDNNKIGDIFLAKQRFDDALAAYREGLVTVRMLAQKEPGNSEWQSLIATGDQRIGDAFAAAGHGDSALTAYQEALGIVNALAKKDPASVGWLRGISEIQLRIGSVLYDRGKIDDAIAAHRESQTVVKSLIERQPDNPRWRRDLMLDNGKIGQLLLTQGKRDEALALYREALAIAKEMGAKYPNDADWQTNRGLIDSNIGPLLMDTGDRDEGLAAYRDGLEIAKSLAAREPRSVDRQANLVIAHYNLGEAGEDSIENFSQAIAILKRLDAAGVLPADKKTMIGKITDEIDRVSKRSAPAARSDKPEKSSALGPSSRQF